MDAVLERFDEHHTEVKGLLTTQGDNLRGVEVRLREVEQKMDRRPGSGGGAPIETIGRRIVESDEFKSFAAGGFRGTARVEVKALTSASGSAGALVEPDRKPDPVLLSRRTMTVRSLVAPGRTISNLVHYVKQVTRSTGAATVAENPSAPKPESSITYEPAEAKVTTIAHWVPVSKQVMADVPALQSLIESDLLYGLDDAEEQQLLLGDGTGTNLRGIMPQAATFNPAATFVIANPTMVDVLLQAIAQAELNLLPATGIVLNPLDYRKILALKDNESRYIGGGPFAAIADRIWNLPKVATPIMPQNNFLVGAFAASAQIFDREDAEVLISSEDRNNFITNMLTVLAEQRLAFAVKRPASFVKGTFPT